MSLHQAFVQYKSIWALKLNHSFSLSTPIYPNNHCCPRMPRSDAKCCACTCSVCSMMIIIMEREARIYQVFCFIWSLWWVAVGSVATFIHIFWAMIAFQDTDWYLTWCWHRALIRKVEGVLEKVQQCFEIKLQWYLRELLRSPKKF